MSKITIIGDGAWGKAINNLLLKNGHKVFLCSPIDDDFYSQALEFGDYIIIAIPSKFFRSVVVKIKDTGISLEGKVFISVAKGIEQNTLMRMSEIIEEELGNVFVAVLSGPSIASEVEKCLPTFVVVASDKVAIAEFVQSIFANDYFRVYISFDVKGVELGGALKNVVAVLAGVVDGLDLGTNAKAGILSMGLDEMKKLGKEMGAEELTFYGLSGLGDLLTTCISPQSRNRTLGERIARGEKLEDIVNSTDSIFEGATTTEAVYQLGLKYGVFMPIVSSVYRILYKGMDPKEFKI